MPGRKNRSYPIRGVGLDPAILDPSHPLPLAARSTLIRIVPFTGEAEADTTDPKLAKALAGGGGWRLTGIDADGSGHQCRWTLSGPASLVSLMPSPKPKVSRPDSAARLAEANAARKAKGARPPAYDPEDF